MILSDTGGMSVSIKNRCLSFQGGIPERNLAVRVTFKSLPPPWSAWNGTEMFVTEPFQASQVPGLGHDVQPPPPGGTYTAARLECVDTAAGQQPFSMDWSALGVVHVFHAGIVPRKLESPGAGVVEIPAEYDIQLVDKACDLSDESSYSPPLTLLTGDPYRNAGWGDIGAPFVGIYPVPDDKADVTVDVVAVQLAFGNTGGVAGTPIKPRSDLVGVTAEGDVLTPDGKIDVVEITLAQQAFEGAAFPFSPADAPGRIGSAVSVRGMANPDCIGTLSERRMKIWSPGAPGTGKHVGVTTTPRCLVDNPPREAFPTSDKWGATVFVAGVDVVSEALYKVLLDRGSPGAPLRSSAVTAAASFGGDVGDRLPRLRIVADEAAP